MTDHPAHIKMAMLASSRFGIKNPSPPESHIFRHYEGILMKKTMIVLAATLGGIAIAIAAGNLTSSSARVQDNASKVQPKDVVLDKDSQSDKYGEVAFNHDTHSLKNYNPEGTAPVACTEC